MDYQRIHTNGNDLLLTGVKNFIIGDILDCGQAFRWGVAGEGSWRGTVEGMTRTLSQRGDILMFHGVSREEFDRFWRGYFDFDRDYGELKARLCRDPVMRGAVTFTPGMRVLRQPPWETLCSFIISANNNIARIRGIVERLCGLFGEQTQDSHAFPTPQRLAALTVDDLAPVRCGYRAAYLLDAARLVAEGALNLSEPYTLPLEEARGLLRTVKGVGPKVAECVLLYGYSRAECVPVDVWIGRALSVLYPGGLPVWMLPVAGLAQQYLFHYVRHCPEVLRSAMPTA